MFVKNPKQQFGVYTSKIPKFLLVPSYGAELVGAMGAFALTIFLPRPKFAPI